MLTVRCLVVLLLVASCSGDKEAKPIQVAAPGASEQSPAAAASDGEKTVVKATEVPAEVTKNRTYAVSISAVGKDLMANLRVLRKASGLKVGEVKALMDGVPGEVKTGLTKADAEAMVKELTEVGFTADMAATGVAAKASGADADAAHSVVLTSSGAKKIHVIKIVREHTGLGLKESKELVESAPVEIKSGISKSDADAILAALQAVGATAEIKIVN